MLPSRQRVPALKSDHCVTHKNEIHTVHFLQMNAKVCTPCSLWVMNEWKWKWMEFNWMWVDAAMRKQLETFKVGTNKNKEWLLLDHMMEDYMTKGRILNGYHFIFFSTFNELTYTPHMKFTFYISIFNFHTLDIRMTFSMKR